MKFFFFLIFLSCSTYALLELFHQPSPKNSHEAVEKKPRKIPTANTKATKKYVSKKPINKREIVFIPLPLPKKSSSPITKKLIIKSNPNVEWGKVDTLEPVYGGHLVEPVVDGEQEIIHGDILIPKGSKRIDKRVYIKKPSLWVGGKVPYTIDRTLPNYQEAMYAIDYINSETNVEFVPRKDEKDYVAIVSGKSNCYSGVGKHGGKQLITLSSGCKMGAVLHELIHTLGFFHEQNRYDRDAFIEVYWGNIEEKYWPQFKKISKESILSPESPFDFKSIMLYPPNFFAKDTNYATMGTLEGELYQPETEQLSYWDKEKINRLYP